MRIGSTGAHLNGRSERCEDQAWSDIKKNYSPSNIFVNIPYEAGYRHLAAAAIATILQVGMRPILASMRSKGCHRLCKICEFIQSSNYILTDISLQRLHNMPYELGFSMALGRNGHTFVLIDRKDTEDGKDNRKFDMQISNLKGVVEPVVHGNDPQTLIVELLRRMQGGGVPEARIPPGVPRREFAKDVRRLSERVEQALQRGEIDEFVGFYLSVIAEATEAQLRNSKPTARQLRWG